MSNKSVVSVDHLADAIVKEFTDYSEEITDCMKEVIADESNLVTEDIRRDSPRRKITGKARKNGYRMVRKKSVKFMNVYKSRANNRYAKGWANKVLFENENAKRIRVFNRTDYQLTHLLEKPHKKVNGGMTRAFPHIANNEQEMSRRLMVRLKGAIEK